MVVGDQNGIRVLGLCRFVYEEFDYNNFMSIALYNGKISTADCVHSMIYILWPAAHTWITTDHRKNSLSTKINTKKAWIHFLNCSFYSQRLPPFWKGGKFFNNKKQAKGERYLYFLQFKALYGDTKAIFPLSELSLFGRNIIVRTFLSTLWLTYFTQFKW